MNVKIGAELMIRNRYLLLLIAVLVAVGCWYPAQQISYDRSIENMFAPDDPLLKNYQRFKRTFGESEVIIAAYYDQRGIDSSEGAGQLDKVVNRIKEIKKIQTVFSYNDYSQLPVSKALGEIFEGYTHSADLKTAAIVCMVKSGDDHRETIDQLREIIDEQPQGVLAGEPVLLDDAFRYLQEDGQTLYWSSMIILSAVILLFFRSLRWTLITICVVQLALLITDATIALCNMQISMVSNMHTSVITVIAVATTVHIIVRYRSACTDGASPKAALQYALELLLVPIFWACLTDAMGFASLLVIEVGPVQDVALMMVIGSAAVIVSVVLVVPPLALLGTWDAQPHRAWGENRLDLILTKIVFSIDHYPRTIGWISTVSAVAIGIGSVRLKLESDFTKNFRADSPVAKSYEIVESRLGGAGVWDVMLPAPKKLNQPFLKRVRKLQARLKKEVLVIDSTGEQVAGLTSIISWADLDFTELIKSIDLKRIFDLKAINSAKKWLLDGEMNALRQTLHHQDPNNSEQYYLRIMLRSHEQQSSENKQAIMQQVREICREEFPELDKKNEDPATGFFVLLTNIISSILADQWTAFAIAAAAIALMIGLAFRSWKLALIALVPNVFPIFVVTGMMGWAGVKVNMGAAMIAAVSMGLSVDSSIHYIATFCRLKKQGLPMLEILNRGHQRTGRAMIFSTIALMCGFTVLSLSNFVPTIYFGVLVSLSMLGGLIGNLLVLPLLLRWAFGGK